MSDRVLIATLPDLSQVLVTEWTNDDGTTHAEVAVRAHTGATWGPPAELEEAP